MKYIVIVLQLIYFEKQVYVAETCDVIRLRGGGGGDSEIKKYNNLVSNLTKNSSGLMFL